MGRRIYSKVKYWNWATGTLMQNFSVFLTQFVKLAFINRDKSRLHGNTRHQYLCQFLGLRSGAIEISVRTHYYYSSVGNPCPSFRDSVVIPHPRLECQMNKNSSKMKSRSPETSDTNHPVTLRNIHRLDTLMFNFVPFLPAWSTKRSTKCPPSGCHTSQAESA
jgi:hypothetical protein